MLANAIGSMQTRLFYFGFSYVYKVLKGRELTMLSKVKNILFYKLPLEMRNRWYFSFEGVDDINMPWRPIEKPSLKEIQATYNGDDTAHMEYHIDFACRLISAAGTIEPFVNSVAGAFGVNSFEYRKIRQMLNYLTCGIPNKLDDDWAKLAKRNNIHIRSPYYGFGGKCAWIGK